MLELQRDVASTLAGLRDRDEAARAILAACLQVDEIDSGGVYLVDASTGGVRLAAHAGLGAAFIERVSHFPPDAPQLRLVSDHVVFAKPYRDVDGALDDVRRAEGLAGVAIVGLRCAGELLGVVNVASHVHENLSGPSVAAIAAIAAVSVATLRRLALEETARAKERQYRDLFESMAQGVVYQEADGRISAANPAALRILGLTLDEVTGRTSSDPRWRAVRANGKPFPGDLHPSMVALKTGQPVRDVVMGVDNAALGARRWLLVSSTPERPAGGQAVQRVFTTLEDITARKRAEDELLRARDDLQRLASHLQSITEEERKAVAREIHDELGQSLTAMKLDLGWLAPRVADRGGGVPEKLSGLSTVVDGMLATVRHLARRLRPAILDDLGLAPAIRWLVDDFEARVGVTVVARLPADLPPVDDRVAIALFRLVQEALTNIARHAGAHRVEVGLRTVRGRLIATVRDDGRGLPMGRANPAASYGIVGMRERVVSLGGSFLIGDAPGGGTLVRAEIPLRVPKTTGKRSRTTTAPR
jgi:PAS domain S-box-containing protein